jgi:hypothetical protein
LGRRRETKEQAQSVLFEKLPRELREMVWGYVLAGDGVGEVEVG